MKRVASQNVVSLPAGAGRSGQPGDRPARTGSAGGVPGPLPLGVQVIAKASDGVDAVGVVLVVEQPDLVVLQDLLPVLPGL